MTTDPGRCIPAARRVLLLIRDLRRRNEAWADGDTEFGGPGNPDVAMFDRHNSCFAPMVKSDDILADVVAAIIAEEMNEGGRT